jgi:hypothetical protein
MAAITIPANLQTYFPREIDPSQLWVNYNAEAGSLTIYLGQSQVEVALLTD